MRHIRYQEIADELRQRAVDSPAGSVLPSEAEMSAEFGASRVTIRRALELVREEGLIAARQGFGWFVATEPVPQSLESLATIESHVEGVGKLSERKIEEFLNAGGKITTVPDGMINAPTHMNQNDYYSKMNKIDGDRKKYLSLNPRRR